MCASKCFKKFKFDDNNNIKITVKDLHKIDIYKPKIHSLSYKFHIQIINHIQKYKKQQRKNQQLINKQQKIINELSEKNFLTSKYSRIDISNIENYDYDAELESIPKSDKSNSWKNHIMYDLFSESDCQIHTGFDRKTIIKQARICQWHPELTFHLRHWIYAYQPRVLHANHFGWSAEKLTKWMFRKTLPIMHQRYAKKVLVSENNAQYYTREIIHQNCPDFVYRIRHVAKNSKKNIITTDSTYQFCQAIQTDFQIRKHTTNMHKHATLLKIHIWACANGHPIYAQHLFGDGYHADGKAFAAALNKSHLEKCKKAILNGKLDETCSFRNMTVISELENLQQLININDEVICDNGYRLRDRHPSLKMPNEAPAANDEGGQVTCVAACHKRGCMACRNGHERMNGWCKRNKFTRTKINSYDIPRSPMVWDIVLADIIWEDIQLSKDDENSQSLADRILDLQNVVINPIDIYWKDKKVQKKNKNKEKPTKKGIKSNYKKDVLVQVGDKEYCQICGDQYTSNNWKEHTNQQKHIRLRNRLLDENKNIKSKSNSNSKSKSRSKSKSKSNSKAKAKVKTKTKRKIKSNKKTTNNNTKSKEKTNDNGNGNEHQQMQKIVHQLGLTKGVVTNINIYGYGTKSSKSNRLMSDHLKVYQEIINIVKMENANKRKEYISKLTTNKLRDIKSKMGSKGTTGRKREMIDGIIKQMPTLVNNYFNNIQRENDNCDSDSDIDSNENIESVSNNNDKQEYNDDDDDDEDEENEDDIDIESKEEENDVKGDEQHDDNDDDDDDDVDSDIEIDITEEDNVSDADDEDESEDEATDIATTKTTKGLKRKRRRARRKSKRIKQYKSDSESESESESQIDSDSEYVQPSCTDSDRLQEYFRKQPLKKNKNKRKRKQSLKQTKHLEYNESGDDDDDDDDNDYYNNYNNTNNNDDEKNAEEKVENLIETIAFCGSVGKSDLIQEHFENLPSGHVENPVIYTDDSCSAPDSVAINYTDLSEGDQSHNEQAEDADQIHHDDEDEDEDEDDKNDWETVAIGWDNIVKYIKTHPTTWSKAWNDVQREDVDNYLGKDWNWKISYSYIRKLAFGLRNFKLMIYKKNPYITKWVNVKSKWRSSKKYIVLLSWYQVHIYNESYRKMVNESTFIPEDELHWYKWLKQGMGEKKKEHPVSHYLHEKHIKRQQLLEERRVKRIIRKNKNVYKGDNIGRMCKEDLLFYAKERNVKIPTNIGTVRKQREYILKTLRERDLNKWEENQICFKCKSKKGKKGA